MIDFRTREVISLNIWICDDEKAITNAIASKIKLRYPNAQIKQFQNGLELLNQVGSFDVLFLDIEMPDIKGITVAEKLRARQQLNPIIFVTAFEQYVFQAFDVQAFHYLLKPFDTKKLYEVLHTALENRSSQTIDSPYLVIKSGFDLNKVFYHEIYYIEVFGRKLTVHKENSSYTFIGRLKQYEENLGNSFFRINRSYLVNLDYITSYTKQQIILDNGTILTLSQKKYTQFIQIYIDYIQQKGYIHT